MIRSGRVLERARNSWNVDAIPTLITHGASLDRTSAHTGVGNSLTARMCIPGLDRSRGARCSFCADRIRNLISRMVLTKRRVVAGLYHVMLRCSFCADRIVVRLRARVLTEAPGRSRSLSRVAALQLLR